MKRKSSPASPAELAPVSASKLGEWDHAYPSRVIINLDAIAGNARQIRRLIGSGVFLIAVVKANAYGHGAPAVARAVLHNGADMLAVANLAEAIEIRAGGIGAPLLVLGAVPHSALSRAIDLDLSLSVFDSEVARNYLSALSAASGSLKVHVKVDSGMGRMGLMPHEVFPTCRLLRDDGGVQLEGIFTHFAKADEDPRYTATQLNRFSEVVDALQAGGIRFPYAHAANSAALLSCGESYFNAVRPGVILYGLNPAPARKAPPVFQLAMTWKTVVAQIKTLPPNSPVGYGGVYRTTGVEKIAVLPVGYADGLRRSPNTWREVLLRGKRAPVIGRVNMEKITINVSHLPDARLGDEVVLLGEQGDDAISADEIAEWIGSNNYEVATAIAPRVPRSYRQT